MSRTQGRVAPCHWWIASASATATAKALAAAGCEVIVHRHARRNSGLRKMIGGFARKQDVTSERMVDTIKFAKDKAGGLDILVNNARALSDEAAVRNDAGRLAAPARSECRRRVPRLQTRSALAWRSARDSGPAGRRSSTCRRSRALSAAHWPARTIPPRGAVRLFTKSVALELAPLRIRLATRCRSRRDRNPKMGQEVVSGFSNAMSVGDNDARTRIAALHALGHLGVPTNIADAITVPRIRPARAFMTGSEMVVDGRTTDPSSSASRPSVCCGRSSARPNPDRHPRCRGGWRGCG